jgi:hypothetical protein
MVFEIEADASIVPLAHQRRRHHRDDLCFKVRFYVLHHADDQKVLDHFQTETDERHIDTDAEDVSYMGNLSAGGLGLCGLCDTLQGQAIKEGDVLRIEIQPPRIEASVRCLGKVAWVEVNAEAGVFRAGVSFVAVNPEDLEKIRPAEPLR